MLNPISPREAQARVDSGHAVLVDIREPQEHAREHIPGAAHLPLSSIDARRLAAQAGTGSEVIFHCQSGNRTQANAAHLECCAPTGAMVMQGGLNEWKSCGLPTRVDRSKPIEMQRQVQIVAGLLILLGLGLAVTLSPWWAALAVFVGAGLTFAGVTGWCGMARLLQLMPWNRVAGRS